MEKYMHSILGQIKKISSENTKKRPVVKTGWIGNERKEFSFHLQPFINMSW